MSCQWIERESKLGCTIAELEDLGYSRLVARLLSARGISAATVAQYFDDSSDKLKRDLSPCPFDLPGVQAAVPIILSAINRRRHIVVFGDYDCDGVCATAIVLNTLRALGGNVTGFLPERLSEGYGMSAAAVARMVAENPDVELVVTVDNGVNSIEPVAELKSSGIDVVITDHHLPGETLPDCPVINPKVDVEKVPEKFRYLCGAGVAYLLSSALVGVARQRGMYRGPKLGGSLLVLAGLATVTDIMPLVGFNRSLVKYSLTNFRWWAPIGLVELVDRASKSTSQYNTKTFSFIVGPRINAAGRMASGDEALALLLETDREKARELALKVDLHNVERQNIEHKMTDSAMAEVKLGASAQVIDLTGGHTGVAGIVAARVLESISSGGAIVGSAMVAPVPVCVVVDGRGSARAPRGYNVRDAFSKCADLLDSWGGHAAAGGFSVKPGKLDEFREKFAAACLEQVSAKPESERNSIEIDAFVAPEELTLELAKTVQKMEPFGEDNEEPTFAMERMRLCDIRAVGADSRHLSLKFGPFRAIWWGHGNQLEDIRARAASLWDVLFKLQISNYGGSEHVELLIISIRENSSDFSK